MSFDGTKRPSSVPPTEAETKESEGKIIYLASRVPGLLPGIVKARARAKYLTDSRETHSIDKATD